MCVASWARWDAQWEGLVELERRCQDTSQEIQMLSKRQEVFKIAIEGKLKMQSRANEPLHDPIVEHIKEAEHKMTAEALVLVKKENDLWRSQNEKEEAKRLRGARKLKKDEEMAWAPPRNDSDWLDWEGREVREKSAWRLEPEGETEVPENIIVSDAVDSTYVDFHGESHHEQAEANISRRERSTRRRW